MLNLESLTFLFNLVVGVLAACGVALHMSGSITVLVVSALVGFAVGVLWCFPAFWFWERISSAKSHHLFWDAMFFVAPLLFPALTGLVSGVAVIGLIGLTGGG